jgi:hypothetical protein
MDFNEIFTAPGGFKFIFLQYKPLIRIFASNNYLYRQNACKELPT